MFGIPFAMVWCLDPLTLYVEILTLNAMVLGSEFLEDD